MHFTVEANDRNATLKVGALNTRILEALRRKVYSLSLRLEAHVKSTKLSGQVLNVVTGRLRRSIHNRVTSTSSSVHGHVGSSGDVKYAGIHEFGGKTPAHLILPSKADALSFMVGSSRVFAKQVHHPGSQMPERSFLRSSLRDMKTEIVNELTSAARSAGGQP
jgi:phage gpG-like protein